MTKEQEAIRALKCLYLEVPAAVAVDIRTKIFDYVGELKQEISDLKANLKYYEERITT